MWLLALLLAALPLSSPAQTGLPPRLESIPSPAPVNTPFNAIVSLPASPASIGFFGTDLVQIDGNTITARFQSGCGFICPGGGEPAYTGFALQLPALAAGNYTLKVVEPVFTGEYVWATLPLTIGPGRSPSLITHPSSPPANQAFDAVFSIWSHPDNLGIDPPPQVDGNTIRFGFDDYSYCASGCSNESDYRSYPVHFPALAPGTYDVEVLAYYVKPGYSPVPPVAKFSIRIGAATSSVSTLKYPALLFLGLLCIAMATPTILRQRKSRLRT